MVILFQGIIGSEVNGNSVIGWTLVIAGVVFVLQHEGEEHIG